MLNIDEFQKNFPPGERVPAAFRALLDFQNAERSWYSGHFELRNWTFGRTEWFAGDEVAANQFAVFGQGPDGSLYALWLYPGRRLENAPVVFLGSEGTDCGLIAGDLIEFMALLAIGADELGFAISWGGVEEAEEPAERLDGFRSWVQASFGVEQPSDPEELVTRARERHPDFDAWLSTWREGKG